MDAIGMFGLHTVSELCADMADTAAGWGCGLEDTCWVAAEGNVVVEDIEPADTAAEQVNASHVEEVVETVDTGYMLVVGVVA